MSTRKPTDTDRIAPELPADVDPETTVWLGADHYHADRHGIPACPEHFGDVDESTLDVAIEQGLEPCEGCEPVTVGGDVDA